MDSGLRSNNALFGQVEFLDTNLSCLKWVSELVRVVFHGATSVVSISFFLFFSHDVSQFCWPFLRPPLTRYVMKLDRPH